MPLKVRTVGYLVGEAVDGIRKNGVMSFASVGTVALSLTILAVFAIMGVNIRHLAQDYESRLEASAFLVSSFERQDAKRLVNEIAAWPGVAEVRFVTKEQGLERLRRQFGEQAELLEAVEENNPLSDSVEVRVTAAEHMESVVTRLKRLPAVEKVRYHETTVRRLQTVTAAVRFLGLVLGGLLAGATLFIISNTIRISVFARRREIGIMKLVGATDAFIRWPFLVEGALLGLAGAALASAACWLGYRWMLRGVAENLPFIGLLPPQPLLTDAVQGLLLTGLLLGAAGSAWSVRRHLRV